MRPLIYHYCLGLAPDQEASIEVSLREFAELMKHPPLEVDCRIARLPENIRSQITADLEHPAFHDCICNILETLGNHMQTLSNNGSRITLPRLLLLCNQQHALARKCLAAAPHASWGVANGCIAVVYELGNHCAIWHELLHTLGAEDCYNTENPSVNRGPTCEHPQCIMQYAATKGVVDGCLPLCSNNASRVRKLFTEIKD